MELAGVAYDTMLESFILDPGRRSHALDNLCLEHLVRTMKTYQEVVGKGKSEIPFAEVTVAGRVMFAKRFGKLAFMTLRDETGSAAVVKIGDEMRKSAVERLDAVGTL